MTTAQIAEDAFCMMQMTSHLPLRQPASDPKVARMDAIEVEGTYDKDDAGLRRSRQGQVGDALMACQVATDTLLIFWALGDGHQRRMLVARTGAMWMDVGGRAAVVIGHNNKYYAPVRAVLAARAN